MKGIKYEKYTCDGFVAPVDSDTVVDVGAFVGEFTVPAADQAKRVIAFEPDPTSYQCLEYNTQSLSNVITRNIGISNKRGRVDFQTAVDPSESSMLDVDEGEFERIQVDSWRLDDVVDECGCDSIDYLKVEAEGAEPEVLESIADVEVKKLAVAADAERFSESPRQQIEELLRDAGYELRVEPPMIYGRKR